MSADHLQLVETVGRHEDEMRRWADKLAPKKPIPGADCCEYGVCTGNYGCPVRQTAADGMCATSGIQCATPWTCAPGCKLITTNSDGTSPDEKPLSRRENRMVWLVAGCMILCWVALGISRIFN